MTQQMDNVEFLREQEASYRRCNTPGEADAFARCAEEIEAARKAKAVPADVAGLVKRLRAYSSADHRASVCDEAARFLESMTPPVDGAANTIPVPQTTLEWIEKKCADKRNPAVSFVCRKLLDGEALSPLRDEQSAPTSAPLGYVLVPVQLTEEMIQSVISWWPSAREIWARLLAARPSIPTASSAGVLVTDEPAGAVLDEIVTRLYRRFKNWHKRGFGPEDVTWCEARADVLEIIRALALSAANGGEK